MIKIKKGLNLPVAGAPTQQIEASKTVRSVAVLGNDYPGMKPTMAVSEGDAVKQGQVLFEDKKNPGVVYTAPVTGTVTNIHRGAKRALLSVVIEAGEGEAENFNQYGSDALVNLSREDVVAQLAASGEWPALRTRPFSKVPALDTTPKSIFVTAMDTNPLAADPLVVINEQANEFSAGLDILARLTDGAVNVCHEAGKFLPTGNDSRIVAHEFAGIHPAGLPGTHIHFVDPVSAEKTVWFIGYQDVIAFGHLFLTGSILADRVVAVAGPGVSSPSLVKTVRGADLEQLTAGELTDGKHRVISGSILSGRTAHAAEGYLGRYHNQVSVLPEDNERRLFGYLSPGMQKHSVLPIYLSKWLGEKGISFTTTTNGSPRGMVPVGSYEEVMPLDILATQLLRALLVGDLENAIALGCLELDEDDIALCTYACPGKYEYGPVLRDILTQIEKEG